MGLFGEFLEDAEFAEGDVGLVDVGVYVFQLMDGRKAVGGKLEVKIRVRDPFVTKQVEEVKEKWLVIDHFERQLPPAAAAQVN